MSLHVPSPPETCRPRTALLAQWRLGGKFRGERVRVRGAGTAKEHDPGPLTLTLSPKDLPPPGRLAEIASTGGKSLGERGCAMVLSK